MKSFIIKIWKKNILFLFLLDILTTFSFSQTADCDNTAGGQLTVGSSCAAPVTFNSSNNTDYWNGASGCGAADLDDAWMWFTATSTQTQITYTPTSGDAIVTVFNVACATGMSGIACANNSTGVGSEDITLTTVVGVTYHIRIQNVGSNNSMNGSICVYNLPLPSPPPPPSPAPPAPNTACSPPLVDITANCGLPYFFNVPAPGSGYVGNTGTGAGPGCAAAFCPFSCPIGSDIDCDGAADLSFSIENSVWFQWCNQEVTPQTFSIGFDEPGEGTSCNVQGAVWVGSRFNSTTIECNNTTYQTFSNSNGATFDGFTFTVTVPVGECAFFMVDGWAGAQCAGMSIVAPCMIPLPITLGNFDGYNLAAGNQLIWTTLTEINNNYFTIERSLDMIGWEEIAKALGSGNSSTPKTYSIIDDNFPQNSKIIYYRLKQTDYDGQFEYFKPIAINVQLNLAVDFEVSDIFPNPGYSGSSFSFNYKAQKKSNLTVSIINVSGQLIYQEFFENPDTSTKQTINYKLLQGLYYIKFENEYFSSHQKLLVYK